jgi:hypothetical protein
MEIVIYLLFFIEFYVNRYIFRLFLYEIVIFNRFVLIV